MSSPSIQAVQYNAYYNATEGVLVIGEKSGGAPEGAYETISAPSPERLMNKLDLFYGSKIKEILRIQIYNQDISSKNLETLIGRCTKELIHLFAPANKVTKTALNKLTTANIASRLSLEGDASHLEEEVPNFLAARQRELKELKICTPLSRYRFELIMPKCEKFELISAPGSSLSLQAALLTRAAFSSVDNRFIFNILKTNPNLRSLDVSHSPQVQFNLWSNYETFRVKEPRENPEDTIFKIQKLTVSTLYNSYITSQGNSATEILRTLFPKLKELHFNSPNKSVVFMGLDSDFWKAFIDRIYHELGPRVFDDGLHGNIKEAGYIANMTNAYRFLNHVFAAPINVDLYKMLHRVACAGFKGDENNTNIKSEEAGVFCRAEACNEQLLSLIAIESEKDFMDLMEEFCTHRDILESNCKRASMNTGQIRAQFAELDIADEADYMKKIEQAQNYFKQFLEKASERMAIVNEAIAQKSKELGYEEPIAQIVGPDENYNIKIMYNNSKINVEQAVQKAFDIFNQKIEIANNDEEREEIIADFCQTLTWIHPSLDGEARSLLAFQAYLNTRFGMHPGEFDRPFIASVSDLKGWVNYIKRGKKYWLNDYFSPYRFQN